MSVEELPVDEKIYLKDLQFDHELWDNEMKYYRNELEIFDHRLEEIVQRYKDREILRHLEHFQNQFIRQNEVLDILNKKVRKHRKRLALYNQDEPVTRDHEYLKAHWELRDEFNTFVKIYKDLKKEFFDYLNKFL